MAKMLLKKNQKFNFSYDKENDDLFLFNPKSKSKGSVEFGDMIIDFDKNKEFVGMQILNASKMISDMIDNIDSKDIVSILNELKECRAEITTKGNVMILKINLKSKVKEIRPIISIPNIRETSPALAYA